MPATLVNEPSFPLAVAGQESDASRESSRWSYHLVVIMLGILAGLTTVIVILPVLVYFWNATHTSSSLPPDALDKVAEYSKWTVSVLLGAFGAWIGAGAAYFFGKENLKESSRSTETALRIQQQGIRGFHLGEKIKDMNLTAMNPKFTFSGEQTKKDVREALKNYKGYWFVPVVNASSGKLRDIVHAQIFWRTEFDDGATINQIIGQLDQKPETAKLHGLSFYTVIHPTDVVKDVYDKMRSDDTEVAIVVDDNDIPTHCVSETELDTHLKVAAT